MPERVNALLHPQPGQVYADATAGLGGHAASCAPLLAPGGVVVLDDLDPANLDRADARVRAIAPPSVAVVRVEGNFAALPHALASGVAMGRPADMLLVDLGFASTQVDDASRGFAFSRDGPLDMRFSPRTRVSAADLVNAAPEAELARILSEYGEERDARAVARKIAHVRTQRPIKTTVELADVVRSVVRRAPGPGAIDPATRTFQALRIAVNDELGSLDALLAAILEVAGTHARARAGEAGASGATAPWLAPGARVVFISFHSLEDRRVKAAVLKGAKEGIFESVAPGLARGSRAVPSGMPAPERPVVGSLGSLGIDEVAIATDDEIAANPRARSAKVRALRLRSATAEA
jgi:16S rRNA (cytosine1402-N4)-methyltransferase